MSEALSPGVAYGCFELLDLLEQAPMSVSAARNLGKLGVVGAGRVTDCTILLGWAEVGDTGLLSATLRGQAIRSMSITSQRLREALKDLIESTDPAWVQNARFGRRRVLRYAPPEIAQICKEAGLSDGDAPDVVAFWDELAARARGLHDVRLNETGREGERLSLAYETRRTGCAPRWISLESNEDGYDVLSCLEPSNRAPLSIEVKASRMGLRGSFYLTRNEWQSAQSFLYYCVHLWDLSSTPARLATVGLDDLTHHLPTDMGNGKWETSSVPFNAFASKFEDVGIAEAQQALGND